MNIKRILAYGAYFMMYTTIIYLTIITALHYSQFYNVNIVCIITSLMFFTAIDPFMKKMKNLTEN
jgi:hypothetical protein